MKFPVLWSGITHSVLGAPVNSTCYIKKIVNCIIKHSGKVPHKVLYSAFEYIHIENTVRYINALPLPFILCKAPYNLLPLVLKV